uniref:Uncharacterized protein n=1 Tax=viral metagenome TaxID=1070528 RepID=A0A6C0AEE8_9ZZZZ
MNILFFLIFQNKMSRSIEAHNRIFYFTQVYTDKFVNINHWNGKHEIKFKNYKKWMQKIKKTINKGYFDKNFSDYCYHIRVDAAGDADDIDETQFKKFQEDRNKIKKVLIKLYPVLKYTVSGVTYDILDNIIDYIIEPLILDSAFEEISHDIN